MIESLTTREIQVLRGVADGLSNELIGHRLHIERLTVKSHIHRILQKLHANNRAHAVDIMWRKELWRE